MTDYKITGINIDNAAFDVKTEFGGMSPDKMRALKRELSEFAAAVDYVGVSPSDIPGLWNAPGYPELTSGQLLDIWRQMQRMKD